ncbi:MAG: ATP-binding protein [Microcoleaceae cyanobacterium]
MSIRNKIIRGYTLALSIALGGTISGLIIGNYYQQKALKYRETAAIDRKFLSTLQLDILYNRPTKQLSPYLQNPEDFSQESEKFIRRLDKIQSFLLAYNSLENPSTLEGLPPLLNAYLVVVNNFSQRFKLFTQKVRPLVTTPGGVREAEIELLQLAKSLEFVKFIEFPEELSSFYKLAEQQEENSEIALARAEVLRTWIIITSLGLSTLLAIMSVLHTSYSIAYPIQSLNLTAQKVTNESNFDLQALVETEDEVGALAISLNQMIQRVQQLLKEQQEYINQLQSVTKIADDANQAKSEFLSNMSHELRTPLNGILGYAQILKRDRTLTPQQSDGLNIIQKSGNHLLTLINDILDLSKIEARKMELYPSDTHLASFLDSITELMRMRALEKDILFKLELDSALPAGVKADEKRLRQVLLNLLGNAVKFTDQGQVILRVKQVRTEADQATLRFEIIDTGVGMTPEQLQKIFQPFEQVGDSKKRSEGTGLGLAITQQLVGLMGGELQVSSESGKGSTFWFEATFPVIETWIESQPEITQQIAGYQGQKRTILVVDDKEENRLVLQHMLEPLGFDILLGEDGQQEVKLAQKHKPDLILTDLVMPVKTGFEAIQEIRQIPEIQEIPIIAISASLMDSEQHKSRIGGCDAFLPKPVEEQSLLKMLGHYLHLEWIYEQQIQPTQTEFQSSIQDEVSMVSEELVVPPLEEIEVLYELAMLGNMRKIQERAVYLEELDVKYTCFSQKIKALASEFRDGEIIALIERFLG